MFPPVSEPFNGSVQTPALSQGGFRTSIEHTFIGLALLGASLVFAGVALTDPLLDWWTTSGWALAAIAVIGAVGLWLARACTRATDSFVGESWALIQQHLNAPVAADPLHRPVEETTLQAWSRFVATSILKLRRAQARGARLHEAADATNQRLSAGRDGASALAHELRTDGTHIAAAASGIMAASARLAGDTEAATAAADGAGRNVSAAIDALISLATATRATTTEIARMAQAGSDAAGVAFAAQRHVASLDERSAALAEAAERIGRALPLAIAAGKSASLWGARAGADGRAGLDLGADLQQMAAATAETLLAMQLAVGELRTETGRASDRVSALADLIQHQHQFGLALGHAVDQQGADIARALTHLAGAHEGIATLREGVAAVTRNSGLRQTEAEILRGAADRLPAHADTIAQILRGIPDFAVPRDFGL
jgi:hypothetical protein